MPNNSSNGPITRHQQVTTSQREFSDSNPTNPPGPTQLSRSAKTVTRSLVASPVVKNIAGLFIAAGAGAAAGCPYLVGILIAVGVGTSWISGAGLIIAGVGIGLWVVSTYLSNNENAPEQNFAEHLSISVAMSAVGIFYAIYSAVRPAFRSCCCREDSVDDTGSRMPVRVDSTPQHCGGMPATGFSSMPITPSGGMPVNPFGGMPGFGSMPITPSGVMPVNPFGGMPGFVGMPETPSGGMPVSPFSGMPGFSSMPVTPFGSMPVTPFVGMPANPFCGLPGFRRHTNI